ncbi:helicase c2 [Fictibacillus macauensis ZFHKF-1]|uniref:Helicase c2 n=1 Tax=Fictibacillus macauensis ZFHKF-1 TaxID=1196324 RepID=I8UCT6_9BACL|nr:ATP-dependent DNA helicase [Fictibacillus macauensis]EIT84735.1 helicase c2 [Fictibacillus macauensis ZFHKF-1]
MEKTIAVSVRTLVEYVFRSGSIDPRFRTNTTLQDGTRLHQKVQQTYNEGDQKEVYLQCKYDKNNLTFEIDGRCDGILFSKLLITIDEIKSTAKELSAINKESYPVHWAQAKVYAYMYAMDHGLSTIDVQLTYIQKVTEEKKCFRQTFTVEELTLFMDDVLDRYTAYATLLLSHRSKRNASIQALSFPFQNYRAGQRKLAGAVYISIAQQKDILAQAPTGIGKTMSTIFPTIKAIGEGIIERFFYVTAKTITREAAENAISLLEKAGLQFHTVTLTAKDKMCPNDCGKDECPFADGHYDRLNGAVLDILKHERSMKRTVIQQYAMKHRLCPFEFSLDLAYIADAVIGDYNYIFDPRVSLKRMSDERKRETALLVDEAHNLVDRGREMFSAVLMQSAFEDIYSSYIKLNPTLSQSAYAVQSFLGQLTHKMTDAYYIDDTPPAELEEWLDVFTAVAERELFRQQADQDLLRDTYFMAQRFLKVCRLYDEHYKTYAMREGSDISLKLFCLDPAQLLTNMRRKYRSAVFFSATLTPLDYYKEMMGLQAEDYILALPSPFSKEQLHVCIQPLSTRYVDRNKTKASLVSTLKRTVKEWPGNYLVFFPSYQYMNDVYEAFMQCEIDVATRKQESYMTEEEREAFLMDFQSERSSSLVGFAVMGGIFSEGVDLVGNRLTGVIIVGVGLPQLSLERNLIKDYFGQRGKEGYHYAYTYPGMNKVLQAGGRLIRTESDQGVVVLIDDRFMQPLYQGMLPHEWRDYKVIPRNIR